VLGIKEMSCQDIVVKAYEFVGEWPTKPSVNDALEAFRDELLERDASEYFRIELSEV